MYKCRPLTELLRYVIHQKRKTEVLIETERIQKALLHSDQIVDIHHLNNACPATYGDYLEVLMFARLLALNGLQIRFFLIALSTPHGNWKTLSYNERINFELEQQKLAEIILPSNVTFRFISNCDVAPTYSPDFVIFESRLRENSPNYDLVPALLHELIRRGVFVIPQNFLLSSNWISVPNQEPVIGWHVRDGLWETHRNQGRKSVTKDFLQIRKMFPNDSIMIFSSPSGISKTMEILCESKLLHAAHLDGVKVLEQPEPGFTNALRYVLSSKFYFQRLGGGIGIVPIFSSIPFIMLSGDENYYFRRSGTKLVPWSRRDQIFLVRPISAGTRSWDRESRFCIENYLDSHTIQRTIQDT